MLVLITAFLCLSDVAGYIVLFQMYYLLKLNDDETNPSQDDIINLPVSDEGIFRKQAKHWSTV